MKYIIIILLLLISCNKKKDILTLKNNKYVKQIYSVDCGRYIYVEKYKIEDKYYLVFVGAYKVEVIELH